MQNRFALVLLTTLMCAPALAQRESTTLYRWVDDNGVIHFSDSPRPGSSNPDQDKYRVLAPSARPPATRAPESAVPQAASSTDPDASAEPAFTGYQSLRIVAPTNGVTLWNIGGTLNVGVQTQPALRNDHGVVIFLDGQIVTPRPVRSRSIALSNVYRGEHVLVAAVRSNDGTQFITSQPVRFVVQQQIVRN